MTPTEIDKIESLVLSLERMEKNSKALGSVTRKEYRIIQEALENLEENARGVESEDLDEYISLKQRREKILRSVKNWSQLRAKKLASLACFDLIDPPENSTAEERILMENFREAWRSFFRYAAEGYIEPAENERGDE